MKVLIEENGQRVFGIGARGTRTFLIERHAHGPVCSIVGRNRVRFVSLFRMPKPMVAAWRLLALSWRSPIPTGGPFPPVGLPASDPAGVPDQFSGPPVGGPASGWAISHPDPPPCA